MCNALAQYGGTIISVSHDRRYLKEVVSTIYELTNDGLIKKSTIKKSQFSVRKESTFYKKNICTTH
ncbi:hypothetical protein OL548_22080 [Lysinibacillus sp. MHQ-1]|nr:hypothetical protein OL548_22080 [Lysinibacillus sp. MHQ-1]